MSNEMFFLELNYVSGDVDHNSECLRQLAKNICIQDGLTRTERQYTFATDQSLAETLSIGPHHSGIGSNLQSSTSFPDNALPEHRCYLTLEEAALISDDLLRAHSGVKCIEACSKVADNATVTVETAAATVTVDATAYYRSGIKDYTAERDSTKDFVARYLKEASAIECRQGRV
jgi:hypothetical protein